MYYKQLLRNNSKNSALDQKGSQRMSNKSMGLRSMVVFSTGAVHSTKSVYLNLYRGSCPSKYRHTPSLRASKDGQATSSSPCSCIIANIRLISLVAIRTSSSTTQT